MRELRAAARAERKAKLDAGRVDTVSKVGDLRRPHAALTPPPRRCRLRAALRVGTGAEGRLAAGDFRDDRVLLRTKELLSRPPTSVSCARDGTAPSP